MATDQSLVEWAQQQAVRFSRVQRPRVAVERNPYDVSTWGSVCARGAVYADTGAPVASGTPGQVRKISSGRKARGMSSDGVK